MKVTMLGTGGFDNEGLPFNSFVVDGRLLVEAPPDVLVSLGREGIDPVGLDTIYLSHCHGDHVFGLPFLLFRLWKLAEGRPGPRIAGPRGIRERCLELCALAISDDHPYLSWVREQCSFEILAAGGRVELAGYEASLSSSFHGPETLGFCLREDGKALLSYIPDTRWDPALTERLASEGAVWTLCDVNGSGGFAGVHMSLDQIEEGLRALDAAHRFPAASRVLGTHVSRRLPAPRGRVGLAREGLVLVAGGDPRESALAELDDYRAGLDPGSPELAVASRLAAFIEARPDALARACLEGHVTGSAFVVDPSLSRILLVHHVKLDKWLQPGGHVEEGETVLEAALREAREETGLECRPIAGGRLFDIDIHPIPARASVPAHFHYDLRWLVEAAPGEALASEESHAVEWLDLEAAERRSGEASVLRPLAKIRRLRPAGCLSERGPESGKE